MQKYFPKGRPKKVGGLVFTNILIAYDKEIEKISRDVKHSLERYKIRIEVQCMQHPKVVKIDCILFLILKIDIIGWTEFLIRLLNDILGINAKFIQVVSKINDGTLFKGNNNRQGSIAVKVRIGDNIAVHTETIKKQQV